MLLESTKIIKKVQETGYQYISIESLIKIIRELEAEEISNYNTIGLQSDSDKIVGFENGRRNLNNTKKNKKKYPNAKNKLSDFDSLEDYIKDIQRRLNEQNRKK